MLPGDADAAREMVVVRQRHHALLNALRLAPPRLAAEDLPWARWLLARIDEVLEHYDARLRQRLAFCPTALQKAAARGAFAAVRGPLQRARDDLRERIAETAAVQPARVASLPAFLPRLCGRRETA